MPYGAVSEQMLEAVKKIFAGPSPTRTTSGPREHYTLLLGSVPQWHRDPASQAMYQRSPAGYERWTPAEFMEDYRELCWAYAREDHRLQGDAGDDGEYLQMLHGKKHRLREMLVGSLAVDSAEVDAVEKAVTDHMLASFYGEMVDACACEAGPALPEQMIEAVPDLPLQIAEMGPALPTQILDCRARFGQRQLVLAPTLAQLGGAGPAAAPLGGAAADVAVAEEPAQPRRTSRPPKPVQK